MTEFMNAIREAFPINEDKLNDVSNLPLIHSTSSIKALKILNSKSIAAVVDDKIRDEESHAYFFYGRAAYPMQKGELPRGDSSYFTVCILMQSSSTNMGYVFPFDTGAFLNKLYLPFINKESDLMQFLLPQDTGSISEFIVRVFGNHFHYARGEARADSVNIDCNTPFEVSAYWNMASNKSAQTADSRCRTIEIVSTVDIQFNESNLLAIVIPEILRDNKTIRKFLSEFPKIDVITYPCFFGDTDDSYYGVVREKVYSYLLEKGLILGSLEGAGKP